MRWKDCYKVLDKISSETVFGHSDQLPYSCKNCVPYLYAILLILKVKIANLGKSFHIHCNSCQLTNCVDPNLDEESAVMILLKRPGYVLLPVELGNDPWFKNS